MDGELIATQNEISVMRDPQIVLEEARKAANALMKVVAQKKKPVIMNGEWYLEFEDWQTVARFYGLTVKVKQTNFLDLGGVRGYEATAEVIRNTDGMVISAADAMCLNDEEKWSTRTKYEYVDGKREKVGEVAVPLFQLRSMAQTRACAKALRNVLAWVVVLAGYKPTPAEEMTGSEFSSSPGGKPDVEMPQPKNESAVGDVISEAQGKRLYAIAMKAGITDVNQWVSLNHNYPSTKVILRQDYEKICQSAETFKATN